MQGPKIASSEIAKAVSNGQRLLNAKENILIVQSIEDIEEGIHHYDNSRQVSLKIPSRKVFEFLQYEI